MGDNWNWGDYEDRLLPEGVYEFEVEDIVEERSRNGEKLMYVGRLRVTDARPNDTVGNPHFERFCIGTDEDPEAKDPKTRAQSRALKAYKRMLEAAGATLDVSMERTIASARGRKFLGLIDIDGDFNRLRRTYRVGDPSVSLGIQSGGGARGAGTPPPPPPPRPAIRQVARAGGPSRSEGN